MAYSGQSGLERPLLFAALSSAFDCGICDERGAGLLSVFSNLEAVCGLLFTAPERISFVRCLTTGKPFTGSWFVTSLLTLLLLIALFTAMVALPFVLHDFAEIQTGGILDVDARQMVLAFVIEVIVQWIAYMLSGAFGHSLWPQKRPLGVADFHRDRHLRVR